MLNPAQIMQEVRNSVLAKDLSEKEPLPEPGITPETLTVNLTELSEEISLAVNRMNDIFILDGNPPVGSFNPRLGFIVKPFKKVLGKLLKWYIKPIADHQTEVNAQQVRAWNALIAQELMQIKKMLYILNERIAQKEETDIDSSR